MNVEMNSNDSNDMFHTCNKSNKCIMLKIMRANDQPHMFTLFEMK